MGVLSNAVPARARASSGATSGVATPEKWVEEWFAGGGSTASGVWVSEETALHYAPFFAGVRVISEDVGRLPLITYERRERGRRRATEHPLFWVLRHQSNDLMTALTFRETVQGHATTWGTGYAYVDRNGAGDVVGLWPLRPDRIKPEPKHMGRGRMSLTYRYTDDVNGIYAQLFPDEVLAVPGLGFDGVRGYSVVAMARQGIGLGLAAEAYGAGFFGNGSKPGGVLQVKESLSDGARKRMRTDWENLHRGLDKAQRVAILEEGATWQSIGIPPNDAQFLETRKFGVTDMARWLRLPPHKIGDLERATFSNIEHQGLDYVASSLGIWLTRWEESALMTLFTEREKRQFFSEHLVDELTRGDIKTRYEAYAKGRQNGWLNGDDIAERENMNPLPNGVGSVYWMPSNMQPAPGPKEKSA